MSHVALMPNLGNGATDLPVRLRPEHVEYLRSRAVTEGSALAAGLLAVGAADAGELLGLRGPAPADGLAIPYQIVPEYWRVRFFSANAPRFLAPKGRPVPVYVPPHFSPSADDPVVVVEGPIKALALAGAGFHAVGLGGTGTTLEDGRLNSSWTRVPLAGRKVVILFDSNRATNPRVVRDETRLALALEKAGAIVTIGRLP